MSLLAPGTVGCTVAAQNYLPHARVLADGWRRHHGDAPLHVLLVDADEAVDPGSDALRVLTPGQLGIPAAEIARMRGIYTVAELSTALKAHALRHLLDGGAEIAVHVDADTDVHASLADAVEPARRHGIVLSPHFLAPPPADGLSPDEFEKQRTGVFNSGFVAVGRAGVPFLAWWSSRVARDCLFDDPMGAHADQRWLDYVPSYFDHHVCRDAGVNVAQWNVAERPIGWDGSAYTAGGRPLRSFHFAGFDPDRPDTPGAYGWATPLRLDAVEQPALQRLCREYAGKLLAAGLAEARATRYRYATTAAGTPLDAWRRRAYRELLLAAEAQGADIPDPFDAARSLELERLLARPARSGLLSPAARARLRDARLVRPSAHGGAVGRAEFAVAFARQTWRQLPRRRHPWMPHPLPSARVRLEYASPGPA